MLFNCSLKTHLDLSRVKLIQLKIAENTNNNNNSRTILNICEDKD